MKIKNIILDPGHGGIDKNGNYTTAPGKMFKHENGEVAYEGKLNREIVKHILNNFKTFGNFGINVTTTVAPNDPRDVSLRDRVEASKQHKANETLFISIHCNAGGGKGTGFELFTSKGKTESDDLAEEIANSVECLYGRLSMNLRYDLRDGDKDKEIDFYVLRKTACPAVLLECGFFDNWNDFKKLKDPVFQKELAFRIYDGIMNFIAKQK